MTADPSRLPAVLFDLDGTLIDSIELIINSARHAFTTRGRPVPTDAEWLEGVGIPLPTMFSRYCQSAEEVDDLIAGYREYQLVHHDRLVRSYDAVVETVASLTQSGYQVGIVTSKTVQLARRGLDHVGLMAHISTIVGCDSCDQHKPHPEPVLLALRQLGASASRAVFIGDSVHDMAAGNAAGVKTLAALWGPFTREQLEPSQPSGWLESITELPGRLDDLFD